MLLSCFLKHCSRYPGSCRWAHWRVFRSQNHAHQKSPCVVTSVPGAQMAAIERNFHCCWACPLRSQLTRLERTSLHAHNPLHWKQNKPVTLQFHCHSPMQMFLNSHVCSCVLERPHNFSQRIEIRWAQHLPSSSLQVTKFKLGHPSIHAPPISRGSRHPNAIQWRVGQPACKKKQTNQKKTHLFKKKNLRHSRRLSVWTLMRLWLPEIRPFKN